MLRGDRLDYLKSSRSYSDLRDDDEGLEDEQERHFSQEALDTIQQRKDQKNKLQELVRQKNKSKNTYREIEENEYEEYEEEYEETRPAKEKIHSKPPMPKADVNGGRAGQHSTGGTKLFDSFGQFFGPSQRVLAPRILEEAKARANAERIAAREGVEQKERLKEQKARAVQSSSDRRRPASGGQEAAPSSQRVPEKVIKARQLKAARDYSFLFNDDDGAAPQPSEAHEKRKAAAAQEQQAIRQPSGDKPRSHASPSSTRPRPLVPKSSEVRRDRPPAQASDRPKPSLHREKEGHSSAGLRNGSAVSGRSAEAKSSEHVRGRPLQKSGAPKQSSGLLRPVTYEKVQARQGGPRVAESGGAPVGRGSTEALRDLVSERTVVREKPTARPGDARPASQGMLNGKPKAAESAQRNRIEGNRVPISQSRPMPPPKQPAPLRPALKGPPRQQQKAGGLQRPAETPLRRSGERQMEVSRRPESTESRPPPLKKAAVSRRREEEDDDDDSADSFLEEDDFDMRKGGRSALSSVLGMFRRNYRENHTRDYDEDSDDGAMEVGWDQVRREESRSARVAKEEDEREAALEEERERRRLEKKKRKL